MGWGRWGRAGSSWVRVVVMVIDGDGDIAWGSSGGAGEVVAGLGGGLGGGLGVVWVVVWVVVMVIDGNGDGDC